jgi:hypothetical protein
MTAQLQHIQTLLNSKKEQDTFVGLYLITKSIKPDNQEQVSQIFEFIPWTFLKRCLLNPSPEQSELKEIALYIWTSFAEYTHLIQNQNMIDLVPLLLPMVVLDESLYTRNYSTLSSLSRLTQFPSGIHSLSSDAFLRTVISLCQTKDESLNDASYHLLEAYVQNSFTLSNEFVRTICFAFHKNQDKSKFKMARLLLLLSSNYHFSFLDEDSKKNLRMGLVDLFTSRLTTDHRDMAWMLLELFLQETPEFLLGFTSTDKLNDSQWLSLLFKLLATELALLMDKVTLKDERRNQMIPICIHVFHQLLNRLYEFENGDPEIILGLRKTFKELFECICQFLMEFYVRRSSHVHLIGIVCIKRRSSVFRK